MVGWRNNATGEERGPMVTWQNKQGIHAKAFSGIHVLSSKIFSFIERKGKFSMIDVYVDLCAQHAIQAFDHTGANLIDVGKPENIQKAESLFK
jgi:NDP-sugar pyrophosphorylase family protein